MPRQKQVIAATAATLTTAAGAVAARRGRTRSGPGRHDVLELPAETILLRSAPEDRDPLEGRSEEDPDATAAVEPSVEERIATAREEGRREARRQIVRGTAAAICLLSIGSLLTLLVLAAVGWLGPADAGPAFPAGAIEGTDQAGDTGGVAGSGRDVPAVTPPAPVAERTTDAGEDAVAPFVPAPDQRRAPSRVSIPAIDVDASVIPLDVRGGVLQVPEDFAQTGWWEDGPEPGEPGPAVIVGHVDSYTGPAVFFRLGELRYDDLIEVRRADGSTATFAVRSSLAVDKEAFPTEEVYGDTPGSELRLITCHGDFEDGSYLGNLIVTAELVGESGPPTAGVLY